MRSRTGAWLATTLAVLADGSVLAVPSLAEAQERPVGFWLRMGDSPIDRCGGVTALTRSVDERLRRSVFVGEEQADITFAITADASKAEIVESDRSTDRGAR